MKTSTVTSRIVLALIALVIGQFSVADQLGPRTDGPRSPSPVSYGRDDATTELHVFTIPNCPCCVLMWATTRQCNNPDNADFFERLRTGPEGCTNFPCGTLDSLKKRYVQSGQIKMAVHTLIWSKPLHFALSAAICAKERPAIENLKRLYDAPGRGRYKSYNERVLAQLGITEDDMKACAPTIKQEMEKIFETSMALAREMQINAVPAFVIGDKKLVGPSSNEEIFRFIDDALVTE